MPELCLNQFAMETRGDDWVKLTVEFCYRGVAHAWRAEGFPDDAIGGLQAAFKGLTGLPDIPTGNLTPQFQALHALPFMQKNKDED